MLNHFDLLTITSVVVSVALLLRYHVRCTILKQTLLSLEGELERANAELRKANEDLGQERMAHAGLQAKTAEQLESAEEQKAEIKQWEEGIRQKYEEIARRTSDDLKTQNQADMEKLLDRFNKKNNALIDQAQRGYQESVKDRAVLVKHIDIMAQQTQAVSKETNNLTEALRGDVTTQGQWGEVKMERILEESGLEKGREYVTQKTFVNSDGERRRPDAVVFLPEGRHIIIDSKVSLKNYQNYFGTDDEDLKAKNKALHVASIRKHIGVLASKDYSTVEGINPFEYTVMFVPVESALQFALEANAELMQYAYARKILLVGPLSLIQTLMIFHNLWRTEKQNENVLQIAKLGGQIHDQFVLYVEAFLDVGNKLKQAQGSYEKAQNRLTDGRGNLTSRLENLKKLGAKTNKQIPSKILDEAMRHNDDSSSIITTH